MEAPEVKARALRFAAPRRVEVVDVDVPRPGEGEVLVRTEWSGISGGTELLAYRGELDPEMPVDEALGSLGGTFRYPFAYGYSCAGRVEGGALPEGARVFAFHPHQSAFVASVDEVVRVDGLPSRVATMFPVVETALQISLEAGPVQGERVVVLGMGPVGLLSALLLGRGGARVIGGEPREWRRKVAADLGVEAEDPDDLPARIDRETDRRGVPLVIEASGSPAALPAALPLLAHEGTALVASWYGVKPVPLPLGGEFHRRRLTIRSTQVSTIPAALAGRWTVPRRRAAARDLMDDLPLEALATHEWPLDAAVQAFEALDRGHPGLLHAALRYG
jgi:2-desacetyl-2-hydroxyethyl bacteriochlorophyllide A dehydrogenase